MGKSIVSASSKEEKINGFTRNRLELDPLVFGENMVFAENMFLVQTWFLVKIGFWCKHAFW